MLDMISDLVSTIIIIIILATFLDLLLPEGSIKRYVKLFIGLLILLTILNPVVSLIDNEMAAKFMQEVDIFEDTASPKTGQEIITRGEKMKQGEIEKIGAKYEKALKAEITPLVDKYFSNYDLFEIELSYNEEWGDDFGEIKNLKVILQKNRHKSDKEKKSSKISSVSIDEVEEIKVNLNEKDKLTTDKDKDKGKGKEETKKGNKYTSLSENKLGAKEDFTARLSQKFEISREKINIKVVE